MVKGKTLSIKEAKSNIIDIENNESLKEFLKEARKFKPLTVEDEVKLFNDLKNAGEKEKIAIRNNIMERCQMLIFTIAKKYGDDENILDLISEGNLGLENAFHDFNIDSGNRFCTYATFHVRKAILKFLIDGNVLIKRKNSERIFFHLKEVRDKFYERYGYSPTCQDIREIFEQEYGIKISKDDDVQNSFFYRIKTFWDDEDKQIFENSKEFTNKTYTENDCLDTFNNEYNDELLSKLSECLSPSEKTIVEMSYGIGMDKEMSTREISDEIGVSQERIRQIKNKALDKMKKYADKVAYRV